MLDWEPVSNTWTVDGVVYPDEQSARAAQAYSEQMEKIMAGDTTNATAEQVVVAQVYGEVLPAVLDLYGKVRNMQEFWESNDLTEIVGQAMADGKTVAGYPPDHLGALGGIFNDLMAWLEEPAGQGMPSRKKLLFKKVTPAAN